MSLTYNGVAAKQRLREEIDLDALGQVVISTSLSIVTATHGGKHLVYSGASAITLTLSDIDDGTYFYISNKGTGTITLNGAATLKGYNTITQNEYAFVQHTDTNIWEVSNAAKLQTKANANETEIQNARDGEASLLAKNQAQDTAISALKNPTLTVKTASYALQSADSKTSIVFNSASALTCTLADIGSFDAWIINRGAGVLTFSGQASLVGESTLQQNETARIIHYGGNLWIIQVFRDKYPTQTAITADYTLEKSDVDKILILNKSGSSLVLTLSDVGKFKTYVVNRGLFNVVLSGATTLLGSKILKPNHAAILTHAGGNLWHVESADTVASDLAAIADLSNTAIETEYLQLATHSESFTYTWNWAANDFSAFTSNIGARTSFNQIVTKIRPNNASDLPLYARCLIRQNSSSGTVIRDKRIKIFQPEAGQISTLKFNFAKTIENLDALDLWIDIRLDAGAEWYQAVNDKVGSTNSKFLGNGLVDIDTTTALPNVLGSGYHLYIEDNLVSLQTPISFSIPDDKAIPLARARESLEDTGIVGRYSVTSSAIAQTGTYGWLYDGLEFSAWATNIGSPQNFNQLAFKIRPAKATGIPTIARVILRSATYNGTIIFDKTFKIFNAAENVEQEVICYLGETIANASDATLWAEFRLDGWTEVYRTEDAGSSYFKPPGTDETGNTTALTNAISPYAVYWRVETVDTNTVIPELSTGLALSLAQYGRDYNLRAMQDSIISILPPKIPVIDTKQASLYLDAAFWSPYPTDMFDLDVICARGRHYSRLWQEIAATTGDVAWALDINFDEYQLAQHGTTLEYIASTAGGGATRKVLFIGDSITAGAGGGSYLDELKTRVDADANYNLTFIGTRNTGGDEILLHEGVAGWTLTDHYENNLSAFTDGDGTFDFNYFLTDNSLTMASGDWVIFHLGTNDFGDTVSDANFESGWAIISALYDTIIADIKATVSGIRIGIATTVLPAKQQNPYGTQLLSARRQKRMERNIAKLVQKQIAKWSYDGVSDVYLVPVHHRLDRALGYPASNTTLDIRITTTEYVQTDSVHPSAEGKAQMADAFYAFLKAKA